MSAPRGLTSRTLGGRLLPRLLALPAMALLLAAAGCGAGGGTAGGTLDVVAVESFLADIAQNVAGQRADVRTLVPLGTDPHSFEPTPREVGEAATADLLIVNGGGLEGPLLDTLAGAGGEATLVDASAGLSSRTPQPGEPPLAAGEQDPHFWLDPSLVKTYVRNIRDALVRADPQGAAEYDANAAAYSAKLDALDSWIRTQVSTLPPGSRKLVMNHASHGYFADRYGLRVVGTVIPSAGTDASPTAQQLARLTATVRRSGARAIFVEAGENPQLARQVAAETGLTVVTDLLDHSLTPPGGVAPSYIAMMKFDARRIVEALK
ncbi:MAG: metal ABC transporter substrate-binding protein [Thermoleophilia bacterium]